MKKLFGEVYWKIKKNRCRIIMEPSKEELKLLLLLLWFKLTETETDPFQNYVTCLDLIFDFWFFDFCLIRNYFFRTWLPSYVQLPNFISQCWSSKGNQVMSILHVLLKMPGGTYRQLPLCLTTTLVWYVPSNPSSALNSINTYFSLFFCL